MESLTATTTSDSTPPSSSMTDSGVTHTIPNNSVVTITRHTVVFSEAPPSTEESSSVTRDGHTTSEEATVSAPASTAPCSTCTPTPTFTSTSLPSTDGPTEGSFSSGAIAGAATGGVIIVLIVLVSVFVWRNRKKHRSKYDASETETLGYGDSRVNGSEKSNHAEQLRPSSDPFAPFGGRVDQPGKLHRPPSGTFEMDGTGIPAVELPGTSISEAPDTSRTIPATASLEEGSGMALAPASDPAATLASHSSNPQGQITYVNQWNQYKALAAEEKSE
ncbi:hypothetical protein E4U55_003938 [Claviceps digitariae]|nr:hypothetical protein E4U55_003938 [Claviceps digitariae]